MGLFASQYAPVSIFKVSIFSEISSTVFGKIGIFVNSDLRIVLSSAYFTRYRADQNSTEEASSRSSCVHAAARDILLQGPICLIFAFSNIAINSADHHEQ